MPRGLASATVHSHMLRHACGFKLAHDGHDTRAIQEWLGHRNIQHATRYTELTTESVQHREPPIRRSKPKTG